jgi:predicted DsbA family dithiol-disulfide isomerase
VKAVWLPFELHPEIPREGMARTAYFSPERLESMSAGIQRMACDVGLTMRTPERMINTRPALATAEFARERGAFDAVHGLLFKLHWEGPGELDDLIQLRRIVLAAGLDGDELERVLASGRYEEALDATRREATGVGINAIPAHIFGGRFLVLGAQPPEIYDQVLARLDRSIM